MHCIDGGNIETDGYLKTTNENEIGMRQLSCLCDICRGIVEVGECLYKSIVPKMERFTVSLENGMYKMILIKSFQSCQNIYTKYIIYPKMN